MRDVPAHAAETRPDNAGIGILHHQRFVRETADIDVDAAHHRGKVLFREDIAFACDKTLFHHVGDVDPHGRAGDSGPVCEFLLGDHGVFLNPAQDLTLTLGHDCFLLNISLL